VSYRADLAVLFEHPEWQKPLFRVLDLRGVRVLNGADPFAFVRELKRTAKAVPRAAATV
jgi:hypothetical protein